MNKFAGIEIGGTKIQVVLGDEKANILQRFRFDVDHSAGAPGIRKNIEETFEQIDHDSIRAIGIGFGGPVDHASGKIWKSYHVDGWSDFPIAHWLSDKTGILVAVENDANVAAIGEAWLGAGRNYESVFYVTLGSGVGSGMVINKRIYHGSTPGECEIGHIRLNKEGLTVQESCSGWAVAEKIAKTAARNPKGILAKYARKENGAVSRILLQAMSEGDDQARIIFESSLDDFAFALSHAVHLLHPQTVVLGGGLTHIGEPLRQFVEQRLRTYLMDAFLPGPDIQLSRLREDVVPVGALALAIHHNAAT